MAAEAHEARLSPLFDADAATGPLASDGGAAFLLVPDDATRGARLRWLGECGGNESVDRIPFLQTTGPCDAVLVSVPASLGPQVSESIGKLAEAVSPCPLITIRDRLGQHASIGATAAALAARAVLEGFLPLAAPPIPLPRKRLLLLELGPQVAAIEVFA